MAWTQTTTTHALTRLCATALVPTLPLLGGCDSEQDFGPEDEQLRDRSL